MEPVVDLYVDRIIYHKDEPLMGWDGKPVCYAARDIWLGDGVRMSDLKDWQIPAIPKNLYEFLAVVDVKLMKV